MLHHPFDGDYSNYGAVDMADVFPILYRRPGDVLMVVTKEDSAIAGTAQVTLDAAALGLDNSVLVFDAAEGVDGALTAETVDPDGKLRLSVLMDGGPAMLRIFNVPSSPTVFWHEQMVWNATGADNGGVFEISASGVPQTDGKALLYYGDSGLLGQFDGADLIGDDPAAKVATLSISFDASAENLPFATSTGYDGDTGQVDFNWLDIPGSTFTLYWADELSSPTLWNEIDGAALLDLVDHGDTWSWTDQGTDPDMGGQAPGVVGKRFYQVYAE